ncbi:MAG: alanine racemase [Kangiellaceae bacterium]
MSRNTVATINLGALHANLEMLIEFANASKVVAVVKANAYGNGAVKVAQSIEAMADVLAVAFLAEATELRDAGITKPILVLQGPHTEDELYDVTATNIIWMLHSQWQLAAFAKYKEKTRLQSNSCWLKFDTGMHRLGLPIAQLQQLLAQYSSIIDKNTVLVTHLANADEPIQSHATAQIDRFLAAALVVNLPVCIANSAANIRFDLARGDYVRLGIAMYGSSPFQSQDNPVKLKPVMSLDSAIISLRSIPKGDSVGYGSTWRAARESVIATVSIGYADGYPRHAPTSTPAWCNNELIPLVGRVSMDMLTFDVSNLPHVAIGDRVQLWGDKLPINDVADHIGTIGYELMTRVSARVARKYVD